MERYWRFYFWAVLVLTGQFGSPMIGLKWPIICRTIEIPANLFFGRYCVSASHLVPWLGFEVDG